MAVAADGGAPEAGRQASTREARDNAKRNATAAFLTVRLGNECVCWTGMRQSSDRSRFWAMSFSFSTAAPEGPYLYDAQNSLKVDATPGLARLCSLLVT